MRHFRTTLTGLGSLCLLFASAAHADRVVFVDGGAPPGGDGAAWESAYRFLQDGLSAARDSEEEVEVRVAKGVYRPDRSGADPEGSGERNVSFVMMNDVAILGGYAGLGAEDPDARDFRRFESVLSGDLLGNDFGFTNNDENTSTVVRSISLDRTARLEGFTVTAGNANGQPGYGGGMFLITSDATVRNVRFVRNFARWLAGGLFIMGFEPLVQDCSFIGNRCSAGGGMNVRGGHPVIVNSLFADNHGTGIHVTHQGQPTLINCTIVGNLTAGVHSEDAARTLIRNGNIYGNGASAIRNSGFAITTARYSNIEGGWDGKGNIDADPLFVDGDGPWETNDYRLSTGSPCTDAADNAAVPPKVAVDLDGLPRFLDTRRAKDTGNGDAPVVDMGAYEFQPALCAADLDGDGMVGLGDLLATLAAWGPCQDCPEDLDASGDVGLGDLLMVLAAWGPCA